MHMVVSRFMQIKQLLIHKPFKTLIYRRLSYVRLNANYAHGCISVVRLNGKYAPTCNVTVHCNYQSLLVIHHNAQIMSKLN